MNIHEYQAKQFLREYGIPVLDGRIIYKAEEAKTAAGELDGPLWVVKPKYMLEEEVKVNLLKRVLELKVG